MKKTINLISAAGLLIMVLLISVSACKKESSKGLNITGKWASPITNSQTSQFEFKSDHTFESSVMGIDSITKRSTGIMSKSVGKYELKNSRLILSDIVSYTNKNNQVGPNTELVEVKGAISNTSNYSITLNSEGSVLSLLYICEVNGMIADCTPSKEIFYQKQ